VRILEGQGNNIMKCVLDTMSDVTGEVDRKTSEAQITQEMLNKWNKGNGRM